MRVACILVAASIAAFLAADFPKPAATRSDEPVAKTFSAQKAAEYLDGVGVNWTRSRKCITCHTNMPYMTARALLPGDTGWKEVREFLETEVRAWKDGDKPRGDAYVAATAFALAINDAQTTGKLHSATREALDRMLEAQLPTGEWKWLKCNWPPMEHDDYYGATVAAVAIGTAPDGYAKTQKAQAGLEKLAAYFKKTPAPDLHHAAMLLWASSKLEGLSPAGDQKKTIAALKARQHEDGGWSLPGLGSYKRRDGSSNDADAPSDGYGTGFVAHVLLQAGIPAADPAIVKAVAWIKANQRESGRWFTRSLNNDKDHFITNAGTAFCIMALNEAGEKTAR